MTRVVRAAFLALLCAAVVGCDPTTAAEPVDAGPDDVGPTPPTNELDLLLVYDNSGSTANPGADIDRGIERMIRAVVSGDSDGDGEADFDPVTSLHVGIINGSLGAGENRFGGPCDPANSTDGLLQTELAGRSSDVSATCPGPLLEVPADRVFAYEAGGRRSLDDVVSDILCEAPTLSNRTGCGIQQTLEATLEALSLRPRANGTSPVAWTADAYRPPTFDLGRSAHGDDPATNGAFLRPDSALAILVITSHDDYSTPNPRLYADDSEFASAGDWLHLPYAFPAEMYPVTRYVDGLVGLRRHAGRFVLAVIGGIPPEVSGESFETILADPMMTPHDRSPDVLEWGCTGGGYAYPPLRLTQFAAGVLAAGGHASAHSQCADQGPAFERILADTIDALHGS